MKNENPVFIIEDINDMKLALYLFNTDYELYQEKINACVDKIYLEILKAHAKKIQNWQLSLADRINRIEMNEQS